MPFEFIVYGPFATVAGSRLAPCGHEREGFPAFAYDMIEPERPKFDARILEFEQNQTFLGADIILSKDGLCRLSRQLARVIVVLLV